VREGWYVRKGEGSVSMFDTVEQRQNRVNETHFKDTM
jgi:hypothetical protein